MRQNITTSDDCREIAIFNLTFPDSRKQFFQTPTAYEKNNDRNVITIEVNRLFGHLQLGTSGRVSSKCPVVFKERFMDQRMNVEFSGLEKHFRTPNNIVVFSTVFFFRFDNNFAISKTVLDLTEICRSCKNYEAGFDKIS